MNEYSLAKVQFIIIIIIINIIYYYNLFLRIH